MKRSLFFLFIVMLSFGAGAREQLNPADVVPEIVNAGIHAEVTKYTDPRFANLNEAEDRYYLDIRLGKLSRGQYDLLRGMYGTRNFMTYSAERDYNLLDFLPASMQAVANQVFHRVPRDLSFLDSDHYNKLLEDSEADYSMDLWAIKKNGLENATNCWSTAIQNLNYIHFPRSPYQLSLPGRWQADEVMKSDAGSSAVAAGDERIYDGLLVSMTDLNIPDSSMLQHAAILIGKKILFEKTDSSGDDPYRIALVADVKAKYRRLFGEQLLLSVRRYGKAPLLTGAAGADTEMTPVVAEVLRRVSVNPAEVATGCETGLGGGCDYYMFEVKTTEVMANPCTQRGILKAPQSLLRRFEALRAD